MAKRGELQRADTPLQLKPSEVDSKRRELKAVITPVIQGQPELEEWCSDSCLLRYLRARKYDVPKAEKMLKYTLQWRASYKPHCITWHDVKEEARTGKTFILDQPDRDGRAIVLFRPRCENTRGAERQIRFLVYSLELASRRADESGVGKMTWLIDFEGYSMRNAPSVKVGIQTLHILQSHYPERLGLAVCYHPPRLFSMMWRAVSPFIDPVTYRKIYFCDKGGKGDTIMEHFFNLDFIEESMGGKSSPQFDFPAYEKQQLADDAIRKRLPPAGATAEITAKGAA